jgi:uncharacterized protein involved in outer membrane biogenesis
MSMNAVAPGRRSPWGNALGVLVLLAAVAAVLAFAAVRIAEQRIANMLGPRSQVADVRVGFTQVVLTDVIVSGATGQADARASRVVLEPEWSSLLGQETVFKRVVVEGFDFAVVRDANGDMNIAPALQAALRTGERGQGRAARGNTIHVADLQLRDGKLVFEDAAISRPPHKIPFTSVQARLHPMAIPGDGTRSEMEFSGNLDEDRGVKSVVRAQGWLVAGGTDADMTVSVRNMGIRHAAPYLAENGAGSLAAGTMDLDMKTSIADRELRASGTVALHGLKFSGDGSLFSLPRKAVLAALKDNTGVLRFNFALAGNLDNPKFSVTRGFSAQVAQGFAHAIGVGAEGAAEGVTGAVKELGNALSDLLSPKP